MTMEDAMNKSKDLEFQLKFNYLIYVNVKKRN